MLDSKINFNYFLSFKKDIHVCFLTGQCLSGEEINDGFVR